MSGVVSAIFGGAPKDNSAEMLKAQQRRSLAELASQQAQIDQAGSGGGGKRGSQMLTYLSRSGDMLGGKSKFGNA